MSDLYFEFDKNILSDMYIITSIEKNLLPARVCQTLDIPSRAGEIFNGSSYSVYEATVKLLITRMNKFDRDIAKSDLRDILNVKDERRVAFNPNRFGFGIPTDEIEMEDATDLDTKVTIKLICHIPYFYSVDFKSYENTPEKRSELIIANKGGEPVKPFLSIGFSQASHFLQLEKISTGERLLVGDYPRLNLPSSSKTNPALYDNCQVTSNWVQSASNIDSDRTGGGTLAVTSAGNGVMLGTVGTGSSTWKGTIVRQNIPRQLDQFTIKCELSHISSGINGDPTKYNLDKETVSSGSTTSYYEVTCGSLNLRSGPSTRYSKKGTISRGYKIYGGTMTNGWLKFEYPKIGSKNYVYVSGSYVRKVVDDTTTTLTKANYVTTQSTPIRSSYSLTSNQLGSIAVGEVVRVITSKTYESTTNGTKYLYYKMAIPYNGIIGYVCVGNLVPADKVSVEYPEELLKKTADDKTGLIELYGFDVNGVKLFKLALCDENKWYEYTYPKIVIGNRTVLSDDTKVPPPKTTTTKTTDSDGKTTVKVTNYLSGALGSWNDFYGKFELSRLKDKDGNCYWDASVYKLKEGVVMKTSTKTGIKYSDLPTNPLSYVVLYIGTTGTMEKCSDMALHELEILEENPTSPEEANIEYFKEGDILDLDFETRTAYLNNKPCNNLVDIGSRFFSVDIGDEQVKISSDDDNIIVGATINEKWLGSE